MEPLNLLDFEALARDKLDPVAYDYYRSGAHDEITVAGNRAAYDRLRLYYRTLVDVRQRDMSATLLGTRVGCPIGVAPTAFHRLAHPEGELATVRAAGAAGSLMILSTLSTTAVEEVMAQATGPVWFQLYIYRDREATRELVARVEAAGCRALVLTVDAPLWGRRERDVRNRFQLPPGLSVANMRPRDLGDFPQAEGSGLAAYMMTLAEPSLTPRDIEWLRSISRLPVVVKGVVRADDARRAVDHGASGVLVSNHGGRQLDTAPPTIEALPRVVEAVASRAEVFVDGGVRRGTDALKALALGARAVFVGRPVLWGLAADGERGVRQVLDLLRSELDLAMGLCGAPTLADLTPDLVEPAPR